jgi:hypothetical protein
MLNIWGILIHFGIYIEHNIEYIYTIYSMLQLTAVTESLRLAIIQCGPNLVNQLVKDNLKHVINCPIITNFFKLSEMGSSMFKVQLKRL